MKRTWGFSSPVANDSSSRPAKSTMWTVWPPRTVVYASFWPTGEASRSRIPSADTMSVFVPRLRIAKFLSGLSPTIANGWIEDTGQTNEKIRPFAFGSR